MNWYVIYVYGNLLLIPVMGLVGVVCLIRAFWTALKPEKKRQKQPDEL